MTQLRELATPFPAKYVRSNPSGGGSYVTHSVVTQRLLSIVGPFDWHVVEIVRGDVAEIPPNPQSNSKRGKEGRPALHNAVVGVVGRLSCVVDGDRVTVEDVGDCEDPHNWPHDGARLKDAVSDAIKRCAARLGLGLHLWAQADYFLDGFLDKQTEEESESDG